MYFFLPRIAQGFVSAPCLSSLLNSASISSAYQYVLQKKLKLKLNNVETKMNMEN